VKNMKKENENARDSVAAIGIGAMIVFIALVLVAAVASAVIIQTGEKLQQNAQQTGSDTQQEIGGKISIITAWVGDQTGGAEEIVLVVETAAGSEPIADTSVHWQIVCHIQNADGSVDTATDDIGIVTGDFDGASFITGQVSTLDYVVAPILDPGVVYIVTLRIGTGSVPSEDECVPYLNQGHTLTISVDGGGSTYEKIYYTDLTVGASIV